MPSEYLERILRAQIYDLARETRLDEMKRLSQRVGNRLLLKREDQQPVFSFKLRGAYNRMRNLTDEERQRGVIAASAGNHAQGVAMAAQYLKVKAVIVMPKTTPPIKVQAVRALGASAILHGNSYDDAYAHSQELMAERGMTFIHPFDEPDVIAGQGTVGMEIMRQLHEPPHAILVPVGGGGLIAGIASYVKYLYPQVRIIGVEPIDAPTLHAALQAGKRVSLDQVGIFADGVAVRRIGAETFRLAQKTVDEVVLVSTDEICAAIKDIFDDTRTIAEPAGALGVAGAKRYLQRERLSGQTLVTINSGANMNFDRLRHVAERAELGEQREALFAVEIDERPGSFLTFCKTIGRRSITEFNYRYSHSARANVFVGLEMPGGAEEKHEFMKRLEDRHYAVIDLSDNETAKLHIRYMVGGHSPEATNERLFRFEFPERPGALLDFLTQLSRSWNISLFHYRNHGAAYGRVLMGLQLADEEQRAEVAKLLEELGYVWWDEGDNPAYRLFAGGGSNSCVVSGLL